MTKSSAIVCDSSFTEVQLIRWAFLFVHFYNVLNCLVWPCVKWSLTGGGRLWEVPVYGFDRKYFWCFAKVVSYGRWSPTGGGRTWRFDCTYVHSLMLVNVTYLLRLFTIYMGKLVGPWFGQLVPKIQDWYISSRICIYYLYKSGILHNLCTPQTSTVRHYWPIC